MNSCVQLKEHLCLTRNWTCQWFLLNLHRLWHYLLYWPATHCTVSDRPRCQASPSHGSRSSPTAPSYPGCCCTRRNKRSAAFVSVVMVTSFVWHETAAISSSQKSLSSSFFQLDWPLALLIVFLFFAKKTCIFNSSLQTIQSKLFYQTMQNFIGIKFHQNDFSTDITLHSENTHRVLVFGLLAVT